MADIMLGAYFKVAQRVHKACISPEPCDACLRTTINAHKIALEGTDLDRSILRLSILCAGEGCVDARYIGELSKHLRCTWKMLMAPLRRNSHAREKIPQVSKVKRQCTPQFAVQCTMADNTHTPPF